MTENTSVNTTSTVETPKAKKPAAKKPVKKPAKKVPAKKSATKTPVNSNGTARRKEGLRKGQIRILAALAKADAKGRPAMTRHTIAEQAPVDIAWVAEFCGKLDPTKRAAADEKYNLQSLVSLGYAKVRSVPSDESRGGRETMWEITASGKKALKAIQGK